MNDLASSKKRELDCIRLYKADGGFIVETCYKEPIRDKDEPYIPNEPDVCVFSHNEGSKMLDFVGAQMGVKNLLQKEGKE